MLVPELAAAAISTLTYEFHCGANRMVVLIRVAICAMGVLSASSTNCRVGQHVVVRVLWDEQREFSIRHYT